MKISGIVKKHLGRGRKLGFPTANLDIEVELEEGIYVGTVGPMELHALIFIGAAETFGEREKQVEVHILDFDEDIYGRKIEVQILEKLRENVKFNNEHELIEQMKKDKEKAKKFFEENI
ncbi:MAG: riboflavin kinase [Candidatus Doudnabacteria bacterium]|nr:riboflavin kinase [Candidatus Doudnabacteria bacterium]